MIEPLIRLFNATQSVKDSYVPGGRTVGQGDRREKREVYRELAVEYLLGADLSRL